MAQRVKKSSLRDPVTPDGKILTAILQEQEETNKLLRTLVKQYEDEDEAEAEAEETVISDPVEQPKSRSKK